MGATPPAADEHVAGQPAAALRPYVSWYTGYRQAGLAPALHRGLPSPFLTIIFTLDEPLTVTAHPDPRQPGGRYPTLVGGLHTAPALISHDGWQSGVQVAMSPLGARALLGLPAGELASLDVDGADVLGPLAGRVRERLAAEPTWAGRFALLDDLFLARAASERLVVPEVRYAWRALLRAGGQVSVAGLAAAAGWSDRHLRSRFLLDVGLAPKAAARVIRFDRARRLLVARDQAGTVSLAGLAADAGYYDQAHLDREFAALAGLPPTAWLAAEGRRSGHALAAELRNVQAPPEPRLAG
jgi:AraC-like DNA-binding protein